MPLEEQVKVKRQTIHTDAYSMSIGEIANIYHDGDLDIHPEFQRIYRWSDEQKTRLIESILLGIPLPSIFVAQREDGVWDVVDGLQRLSTILSFLGELKNEDANHLEPLILGKTEYLPALEGLQWEHPDDPTLTFPLELKRAFKREKLDLKIVKAESDAQAKFELFQRLNTGGSNLSEQEVRNCLLIMLNRDAYVWMQELSENPFFQETCPITQRQIEEAFYMELVLRFFVYRANTPTEDITHSEIGEYLTHKMKHLFISSDFDFETEKEIFEATFEFFSDTLSDNSFQRYNTEKRRYEGAFLVSLFEVLAPAISEYIAQKEDSTKLAIKVASVSKSLASNSDYSDATKPGSRAISRYPKLVELGHSLCKI